MRTRIKICGLTRAEDALAAVQAGADAIGVVLAASPRRVTPAQAAEIVRGLPPLALRVGVFMDQTSAEVLIAMREARLDVAQLHGDETPHQCAELALRVIKRIRVLPCDDAAVLRARMRGYDVSGFVLDPGAGSGKTFDWAIAAPLTEPLIISGGLTPENVGALVQQLRPHSVDVSSGVERAAGVKCPERMRAFVQAVRSAEAHACAAAAAANSTGAMG